jgi:hypothetical protein
MTPRQSQTRPGPEGPAAAGRAGGIYPYFSQWESPELVPSFLDSSRTAEQDPEWHRSGAASPAEYAYWAVKTCGLACLKMILAARGEPVPPTMRLVDRALDRRAFVPIPGTSRVHGLIYRPFADWVAADYGIAAEVAGELTMAGLVSQVAAGAVVIASVHPWVRWPDRVPPDRGGHLVLVTGRHGAQLILNNPSGLPGVSQHATWIALSDFARFYAGRGIVIRP